MGVHPARDQQPATLSQSTTFDEKDGQWRPLSGTDSSAVFIKHKDKRATYDWDKGVATFSGDVKPDRMGPVKLQPGGFHIMLLGLKQGLAAGSRLPLTLTFEKAGSVQMDVPVEAMGSMGPSGGPGGHAGMPSH